MPETVFTTRGRKYHADAHCPAMLNGEGLWAAAGDAEGWPWHPGTYRREDPNAAYAAACGKLPCLHCVPAEQRTFPPLYGQTFGHELTMGIGLDSVFCDTHEPVCNRCTIPGLWFSRGDDQFIPVHVSWPCTSAIVLGLAEREPEAA